MIDLKLLVYLWEAFFFFLPGSPTAWHQLSLQTPGVMIHQGGWQRWQLGCLPHRETRSRPFGKELLGPDLSGILKWSRWENKHPS